jgi:hypothetical protein
MPKFRIYYTEESHGNILFDAENMDEARKLYNELFDNEIFEDELPNFERREKSGQVHYTDLRYWNPDMTILKDSSE